MGLAGAALAEERWSWRAMETPPAGHQWDPVPHTDRPAMARPSKKVRELADLLWLPSALVRGRHMGEDLPGHPGRCRRGRPHRLVHGGRRLQTCAARLGAAVGTAVDTPSATLANSVRQRRLKRALGPHGRLGGRGGRQAVGPTAAFEGPPGDLTARCAPEDLDGRYGLRWEVAGISCPQGCPPQRRLVAWWTRCSRASRRPCLLGQRPAVSPGSSESLFGPSRRRRSVRGAAVVRDGTVVGPYVRPVWGVAAVAP